MSKCPICGGECVTPKQEDLDYLTNLLKSNDEFVLMAAYDHFYSYCPSCYIPYEKDYTANQLEALKQKQNELKSIFEDNSFVEFDKNKYALICEMAGYGYEIAGLHDFAALAYSASSNILNGCLVKYMIDNKSTLKSNFEPELNTTIFSDFSAYENAVKRIDFLKRLAFGHLTKTQAKSIVFTFICISLLIDLNDAEGASQALDKLEERYNQSEKNEWIDTVIAMLRKKVADLIEATTITIDLDKQ